jgi:putative phosphoribosyl transferase
MYFRNRAEAGRKLTTKLLNYKHENTVVMALSPGGVIVGAQIAMKIHANLMFLLTENIYLPGEHDALAAMSSVGSFTYNNLYTPGQLEEFMGEYHQFIEAQKIEKLHKLNVLMGHDGEIHKDYLRRHNVILVSDGLSNGFSLEVAAQFLNTVAIKRLIIVTPLASIGAVDKMHLIGDEIVCLSVVDNYINTEHYYDDNTIPPIADLLKVMRNIPLNWDRKDKA